MMSYVGQPSTKDVYKGIRYVLRHRLNPLLDAIYKPYYTFELVSVYIKSHTQQNNNHVLQ